MSTLNEAPLPFPSLASSDEDFTLLMSDMEQPMFAFAWHYLRDAGLAHELVVASFVRFYQVTKGARPNRSCIIWLFAELAEKCRANAGRARPAPSSDEVLGKLIAAIIALRHDKRTAWILQQCTPLSLSDIASILGVRVAKAKELLKNTREQLRRKLMEPHKSDKQKSSQKRPFLPYQSKLSPAVFVPR
jgi:DNA-directed RNA polymerase specialized sigma24 family protein